MKEILKLLKLLIKERVSPLSIVEQIRSHPYFPYLVEYDFKRIVNFLNKTSFNYSKTNIKYELYLLFTSYHLLPSPYATCRIGEIYLYGMVKKNVSRIRNVRRNYNKALQYLTLSSAFNHPKANYLLGMFYHTMKDYETMIHFIRLSASMCYSDALFQLGTFYYHGMYDIQIDFQIAYQYFEHSASHGNPMSIFMLNEFGDSIHSQYISQRIDEMRANGMSPITEGECPVCFDPKVGYTLRCHNTHFICCDCLSTLLKNKFITNTKLINCPICRAES